jgi:hypothetical protein
MPAYALTYGGVPLALPAPEVLIDRAAFGELDGVHRPFWTGLTRDPHDLDYAPIRTPELNRLYWPRMASRFAVGYFLANEAQMAAIRSQAITGDSRGVIALPFVGSDGNGVIETDLYLIGEARPLYQWDTNPDAVASPGENLYVLTLVDERYWWMSKTAQIAVTSQQSWETLYAAIATALGISITVDTIPAAYLSPAQELTSKYHYLPPLLDAVAYSCGQRIIRTLDGSVIAQNASSAQAANTILYNEYAGNYTGGGVFRFDRTSPFSDLAELVPNDFRMVFPIHLTNETKDPQTACADKCGDVYEVSVTLQSLALPLYSGIQAKSGTKTIQTAGIAWYYDSPRVLQNGTELNALATQFASDWYTWQAIGDQTRIIPSLVEWTGEGANDFVEWQFWPRPSTMVIRDAVNDLALWTFHETTRPAPDHSSGSPASSGAPYSGKFFTWKTSCEAGKNNRYYQITTVDFVSNAVSTGPLVFESVQGCCDCYTVNGSGVVVPGGSSGPLGSSGPIDESGCVSGTTNGIPWLLHRQLKMYFLQSGTSIADTTVIYTGGAGGSIWNDSTSIFPCSGSSPGFEVLAFEMRISPDGTGMLLYMQYTDTGYVSPVVFYTFVPMPLFGAGFVSDNLILNLPVGAPGANFLCGDDLADDPTVFALRIIGESCAMPPQGIMPDTCTELETLALEFLPIRVIWREADAMGAYDPAGAILGDVDDILEYVNGTSSGCGANEPTWSFSATVLMCPGIDANDGVLSFCMYCCADTIPYCFSTQVQGTGAPSFSGETFDTLANGYLAGKVNIGTVFCGSARQVWMEVEIG